MLCVIFSDVATQQRRMTLAAPTLSVTSDGRSKKSATKSSVSSTSSRRQTLPNSIGGDRFGPVRGKDVRVITFIEFLALRYTHQITLITSTYNVVFTLFYCRLLQA